MLISSFSIFLFILLFSKVQRRTQGCAGGAFSSFADGDDVLQITESKCEKLNQHLLTADMKYSFS